jgi:UDP-N-acetylglucosamine--N-acetylmuramyl-(pentapeptide) pyrophosphoryl-undecaprenol N-acetylglucosamine transferase
MGQRVMILAGGTGGHVYPALAVARELLDRGHEVIWMGTHRGLEARVVPAAGIPMEWLAVEGIRGKGVLGKLKAPLMLMKAFWQSWKILRKVRPDVVLGMGGFVSGPGGLVASLTGIPLILHEQNRVPGTTNRLLASRARVVLQAFADSFSKKVDAHVTGNPVRREIVRLANEQRNSVEGRPIRLLVVGGSLGAKALNELVPEAISRLEIPLEVRHQTGQALRDSTEAHYRRLGLNANVVAFIEDMAEAYSWADLAICRAGAMTVSELAITGLPALLVPYPHAIDDHQTRNAEVLEKAGGAVLLPQSELTAESLAAALSAVIHSPENLELMSQAARSVARPAASEIVAAVCVENASRRVR